jgi:S1-C subfamily serine protease
MIDESTTLNTPHPISQAINYIDPRTMKVNDQVDLSVLFCFPEITDYYPQRPPNVRWGDSSQLGVGDPIAIGGYPLGRNMFLLTQTNRGIVQPTFYEGIISAILPATKPGETRLIQITAQSMGGISGGALFNPKNGEVLGMVTSGLNSSEGTPLPVSYAIPSEVIVPYVKALNFETKSGERVR